MYARILSHPVIRVPMTLVVVIPILVVSWRDMRRESQEESDVDTY